MAIDDRQLVEQVEGLLQAWDAAFARRDKSALDRLSEQIEAIVWTPEFLVALRSAKAAESLAAAS